MIPYFLKNLGGGHKFSEFACFTSITQKSHGTYKHVLEGADVGVCGFAWLRKLENPGKTTNLGSLPCHMYIPGYEPGPQR